MFIGEGPGAKEDALGRPFVGPAGQVLNQLLASIGLKREDVYISNMVKHRPPDNRDPLPGEIQACAKYLEEQIKLINPKVVIPLGRHALAKWFPKDTISKVHGRPRRLGELTLFPQYHPAAVLHNPTIRPALERDFQEMGKLLHQDDIPAEPETTEELDGQQLSML
jgi:DNA polymerase